MATIVQGDDLVIPVTLKKDDATFTIDTGSTVKANFVSKRNGLKMLSTDVTVARDPVAGDDWANSLVVVQVASATSANLTPGQAVLEIQVDDTVNTNGKLTWRKAIRIVADTVT